jgi:hypothetical protein
MMKLKNYYKSSQLEKKINKTLLLTETNIFKKNLQLKVEKINIIINS